MGTFIPYSRIHPPEVPKFPVPKFPVPKFPVPKFPVPDPQLKFTTQLRLL